MSASLRWLRASGRPHRSGSGPTLRAMATVTVNRSDLFPVGTSVGIYPPGSGRTYYDGPPTAAVIQSATVDAAGLLTVTDAGIVAGKTYVAYAAVGGQHRQVSARSTLDKAITARATGTGDTTSGSAALANVSATTGAFAVGQRITGPGIPPGTYLIAGSGAAWTMSDKATASASTVALEGHGAAAPVAGGAGGVGSTLQPLNITNWRAKVMQRRSIAGTS